MFERRGGFNISRDVPHRRASQDKRISDFQYDVIIKQSRAASSYNRIPSIKDVYKRALRQCTSITIDPRRQEGLPCITGTRIPVHLVLWAIEQTGSIDGAILSYPDLTVEQVKDAIYFAETVLGSTNGLDQFAPIA
jgi:uncharacterized protein (DUF433 family)